MNDAGRRPEVSVVIPAKDEADNLVQLVPEIVAALGGVAHEVIIVDDGSSDRTPSVLDRLTGQWAQVRGVVHPRSFGKSAAIWSGTQAAHAPIVVTVDGDGQNDPATIPAFISRFADPSLGLVAGQRTERRHSWSKNAGSRLANGMRRALLKDHTRDSACGLKAFRREGFLRLPYFETMHRFLPALFIGDGWRIDHIDVVDRSRRHGSSHYGVVDRLLIGIPDLFGVWWMVRRRRRSPFRVESDT